jgi:phosphate starvation-inducible PhoH-like protein
LSKRTRQRQANKTADKGSDRNVIQSLNDNVVRLDQYQKSVKKNVVLIPKNVAQEKYVIALENQDINIVFAAGPAGTGKTMLATLAGIDQLRKGDVDKIVITRPAISVDEQHGFLPGSLVEKMHPWVLPILDYFYQYYSKKEVLNMIEDGVLEIAPLAYMRGRTFLRSFIIGDEMQNATPSQMKMVCTRIGDGSKLVITGDVTQHDRGYDYNGLKDIMGRYTGQRGITVCRFNDKDVERHPIIETILEMYGEK